jgi:protein phosphatase
MTRPRPPLQIASLTDTGKVRSHNEDNHLVDADAGYAVLADGMGGYNAGEVASEMAVAYLAAGLTHGLAQHTAPVALLKREIEQINAAIHDAAQTQPHCAGMGTTLVAALFQRCRVIVAHVGDSRLYRLRGDCFEALTRDHSFLQEQIDCGLISKNEALRSHHRNLVTRALGGESGVAVDVAEHEALPGDLYLLCSDGLNDMVPDEDIGRVLRGDAGNLAAMAAQLVRMANDNGGRDNVTVILARLSGEPGGPEEQPVLARLAGWMKQGARRRPHDSARHADESKPPQSTGD